MDQERFSFHCTSCEARLTVRFAVAGCHRRCPGCGADIKLPLQLRETPLPMPNQGLADYVALARETAHTTKQNCRVCQRAGDEERFRKARKDGIRTISKIHTSAQDVGDSDRPFSYKRHDAAERLKEIASVQGTAVAGQAMSTKHKRWLSDHREEQRIAELAPALAIIAEARKAVMGLVFEVSLNESNQGD